MPYAARTSLAALVLCLALGIPPASAQQGGTAWTDPPARKPETEAPGSSDAAKVKAPRSKAPDAAQSAAPTLAAGPKTAPKAADRAAKHAARLVKTVTRRETAARTVPAQRRVAAKPSRVRSAAASRPQATPARLPRMVAAAPPRGRDRIGEDRIYTARPYGYGPGYGPGYADERLERLRSAADAGYIVVHRRTVDFPDGRSLRVYRPLEDESEPF